MRTKRELNEPIEYPTKDEVQEMIEIALEPYKKLLKPRVASIQRVETFNDEVADEPREDGFFSKWSYEEKLASARNAAKILPPNMIKDGRHSAENIQAICGFLVDDQMMDDIYSELKHEEY